MWPAVSKRLNPWPRKTLLKLRALFRKLTNGTLWKGHSFCKWTVCANSWALSPKKWKSTKQTFDTGAQRFTEIMERLNHALAERLFGYQSGNGPLLGLKAFLKLFVLWIVKSRDWWERNLLKLSKKKRLRQNWPHPICALSEKMKKNVLPMSMFVTCISLVSWKAGGSGPQITTGLWKCTTFCHPLWSPTSQLSIMCKIP